MQVVGMPIRLVLVLASCLCCLAASTAAPKANRINLQCGRSARTPEACKKLDHCAWCTGKVEGLKAGCFNAKRAIFAPKRLYTCSKNAEQLLGNNPCEGKAQGDCSSPACVWCKSSAVPSACFTLEEAKHLPGSIFKCQGPASLLRAKKRENAHRARQNSRPE